MNSEGMVAACLIAMMICSYAWPLALQLDLEFPIALRVAGSAIGALGVLMLYRFHSLSFRERMKLIGRVEDIPSDLKTESKDSIRMGPEMEPF